MSNDRPKDQAFSRQWGRILLVIGTAVTIVATSIVTVWPMYIQRARRAQVRAELAELNSAIESREFQNMGFAPRIGSSRFRRDAELTLAHFTGQSNVAELEKLGLDLAKLDAREVLVYYLAGLPRHNDALSIMGFDKSPRYTCQSIRFRMSPHFDFEPRRLTDSDGDGWLEYAIDVPESGDSLWFEYDETTGRAVVAGDLETTHLGMAAAPVDDPSPPESVPEGAEMITWMDWYGGCFGAEKGARNRFLGFLRPAGLAKC